MTTSGRRRLDSVVEHSSAGEEIAGNEDLVAEILVRLSFKSLLRFESVSKKWLSLISHHYFSQNYFGRRNPNFEPSGLILYHEHTGFQFVDLNDDVKPVNRSYPELPRDIVITQSCNGLLICISSIPEITFCPHICNPTTKQFTPIRFPNPEFTPAFEDTLAFEDTVVGVNLAFDPFKSPHYKLLCVQWVNKQNADHYYQVHIYSSETRSWRNPTSGTNGIPLIFTLSYAINFMRGIYCNGAVHWYSDGETSLYFNTDTECLKTMPMPPLHEGSDRRNVQYFGESRGHLHLIVFDGPSAVEFEILELKTDYSGWFVRYRVNLDAAIITFPVLSMAFSVMCVVRAEKEEKSMLVLFASGKVISFNLKDRTSEQLCDLVSRFEYFRWDYLWSDAYQYIETLFHC